MLGRQKAEKVEKNERLINEKNREKSRGTRKKRPLMAHGYGYASKYYRIRIAYYPQKELAVLKMLLLRLST